MNLKDVFKKPPQTVSSGIGKSKVKFKKIRIKKPFSMKVQVKT